jgi:molecular chaperone DnaK
MADSIVHSTKQLLDEHKDEVSDDEKTAIEAAVTELEEVMKTEDKEALDALMVILCSLPEFLSLAETFKIPSESMSKVTSICG